jgi:hypothetical protein
MFRESIREVRAQPVAAGEERVDAGVEEEPPAGAEGAEVDGWPVLSELELDVCLSESTVPGVRRPAPDSRET